MQDAELFDIAVAGGGSAGVAAAARSGARTVLLEKAGCLGGASTIRNVLTYCGLYTLGSPARQAVRGIADELLAKLRARGTVTPPMRHRGVFVVFDPEAVKLALDELCADAGVDVFLHAFVSDAERDEGGIREIAFVGHGGRHRVRARAFIDASGDCDLAALSGASVRYGNHGGLNLGTLGTRFGGIPCGVEISAEQFKTAVDAACQAGARLTKDATVMTRLPGSQDICCYLASADYDPRDVRSLSAAERDGRRQAQAYLDVLRGMPGCGNAYLVSSGPEFGTRESRHINAAEQLVWDDVLKGRPVADSIGLGAWGSNGTTARPTAAPLQPLPAGTPTRFRSAA